MAKFEIAKKINLETRYLLLFAMEIYITFQLFSVRNHISFSFYYYCYFRDNISSNRLVYHMCGMVTDSSQGPFKYYVSMCLAFLGPPTYVSINSTVNQQKLPFSDPTTHLFADAILEWSFRDHPAKVLGWWCQKNSNFC